MAEEPPDLSLGCKICSVPRVTHERQERAGQIKHAWSADGEFGASELEMGSRGGVVGKKTLGGGQAVNIMVSPAPDVMLRELLVQKGLLTRAEVDTLAMPIGQIRLPGEPQRPSGSYEELDKDL